MARRSTDADWDLEIGALTEAAAELIPEPPLLLFDHIKRLSARLPRGEPAPGSTKRAALALGLPLDRPKLELVRLAARKMKEAPSRSRRVEVASWPGDGERARRATPSTCGSFPVPRYHADDGGRYIGTGDTLINRDPDSGARQHGHLPHAGARARTCSGLWMSPGQHGRLICQRYWERGEACPVVATFGGDPLTFMAAHTKIPWGRSELEFAGGLRGRPLEVIRGPAHRACRFPRSAEIAIEGEVPPPERGGARRGPVWRVAGLLLGRHARHRAAAARDPRQGALPPRRPDHLQPGAAVAGRAERSACRIAAGLLWDQLEARACRTSSASYMLHRLPGRRGDPPALRGPRQAGRPRRAELLGRGPQRPLHRGGRRGHRRHRHLRKCSGRCRRGWTR